MASSNELIFSNYNAHAASVFGALNHGCDRENKTKPNRSGLTTWFSKWWHRVNIRVISSRVHRLVQAALTTSPSSFKPPQSTTKNLEGDIKINRGYIDPFRVDTLAPRNGVRSN
jgi:hypothetical protein